MTPDELESIRQVIREELRRELTGPRCPDCGEPEQGMTMEEVDRMIAEDETWEIACPVCDYSGPAEEFDPLMNGLYPEDTP